MSAIHDHEGNQGGRVPSAPKDKSGVEPASEPKDLEKPNDQGIERVQQMQHADESSVTEEAAETTRTRGSSASPEVGLPSDAERRSDEL